MSSKFHSQFVCQQCGYSQVGWAGKCPNCGEWNTLVETVIRINSKQQKADTQPQPENKPILLNSISSQKSSRIITKIPELDRVLGGGIVPGQVILLAGEPGIGKSTLLLEIANLLSGKTLYVSGEESIYQIKLRAERLGTKNKNIELLEETDVDQVISEIDGKPQGLVVIDSIQTMSTTDLSGMAGSVGQVRECAFRLLKVAKTKNIPLFIAGHVTKEGSVAGPAVLAHIVDTVLWFEGDKNLDFRLLRAIKNRFGPTDEVGIFSMGEKGLVSANPQDLLLKNKFNHHISGTVAASVLEGTRPILVEIQSLVVPSKLPFPKRVSQGLDAKKFELLLGVLTRRCGLPLGEFDCFVNVTSGFRVTEPGADLAICMSIASSFFDKPLPQNTVCFGEVGLLGEIRQVQSQEKRVKDAKRLGYKNIINSQEFKFLNPAFKKYFR